MHLQLSDKVIALGQRAQTALRERFFQLEVVSERNTQKVLAAFQANRVSEACFAGTTGYGYDDLGRGTLDKIYADVFGAEAALVRIGFVNGTHAIASALFGCLRPGDLLISAVGAPYDTLHGVIGITPAPGSLREFGVSYHEVPLKENAPDLPSILRAVRMPGAKALLIQRSRGYAVRASLSVDEIGEICAAVRRENPGILILVDNCYGEFVEEREPTEAGADLIMGSLIKNPGGGLAPTGGYVAGRRDLVEAAAMRLTVPGIGGECGATLGQSRLLYQGLFLAPHTVCQAVKTAVFAAKVMELLGYEVEPGSEAPRRDIIQMIRFGSPTPLKKFCRGIQAGAPVDSFVTPEPWDMPGYDCPVIMAAGAFNQGASIELSADAPMREPYALYLQGGLTYEAGKAGILLAVQELLRKE